MSAKVTKVGGAKKGEPKEKKEKVAKVEWNLRSAQDASGKAIPVNDKGELTAIPANYPETGVLPLKRGAFASRKLYFGFRAAMVDRQIATLSERRKEFLERAEGKDGGSTKRRIAKAEKIKKQLQELKEQLKAEGVDLDI